MNVTLTNSAIEPEISTCNYLLLFFLHNQADVCLVFIKDAVMRGLELWCRVSGATDFITTGLLRIFMVNLICHVTYGFFEQ
jgi:hypothetical protein